MEHSISMNISRLAVLWYSSTTSTIRKPVDINTLQCIQFFSVEFSSRVSHILYYFWIKLRHCGQCKVN